MSPRERERQDEYVRDNPRRTARAYQSAAKGFIGFEQMMQISPRVVLTRIASTGMVDRPWIYPHLCLGQLNVLANNWVTDGLFQFFDDTVTRLVGQLVSDIRNIRFDSKLLLLQLRSLLV